MNNRTITVAGPDVLLHGVVALAVARRRERKITGTGGRADQVVFARAIRTGEAPADTSLGGPLLALVRRRRTQLRRARYLPGCSRERPFSD
jgi:hypothetical protein